MSVKLVMEPFVRAVARPHIDETALVDFIHEHDLDGVVQDVSGLRDTPLARLFDTLTNDEAENMSGADWLTEFAGRFCYRSWESGRGAVEYFNNTLSRHDGNIFAHATVSFIVSGVSRALSHELVRHHVGVNPSQESQRYVTAASDSGGIELIGWKATRAVVPPLILHLAETESALLTKFQLDFEGDLDSYELWRERIEYGVNIDQTFSGLSKLERKKRVNEAARWKLPNACETRLVWTMNLRAARWVIENRGAATEARVAGVLATVDNPPADLEIRRLAVAFLIELQRIAPLSVKDMFAYTAADGFPAVGLEHRKI